MIVNNRRGQRVGLSWCRVAGSSWLVLGREGQAVFLYPDLVTALVNVHYDSIEDVVHHFLLLCAQ